MNFFARVCVFLFALLAVATASPAGPSKTTTTPAPTPTSQCNTGSAQCCQSVQKASSGPVATILGLLGIILGDPNILVGLTCSPLSVIGVGGNSCSQQPVCCSNNNFNGIVAIGCTPININL